MTLRLPCRELTLAAEKVGGDAARLHAPLRELESGELQLPTGAGTGCLSVGVALDFACEVILVGGCNPKVTGQNLCCTLCCRGGSVLSCICQQGLQKVPYWQRSPGRGPPRSFW